MVCLSADRNNHRYAVVVQDLATQWIQSYPCKNKNFSGDGEESTKVFRAAQKPKVIYTENPLEFSKSCEELSWNHRTSTPYRSETNGIAVRATRRVKEVTSSVQLQSGGRLIAKEVLITPKDGEFVFPVIMVQQNCQSETANSKNPL